MTQLTDEQLTEIEKAAESFLAVVKARFRPDLNYDDLPSRESSAAFVCSQVGQLVAQARRNRRVEEAAKLVVTAWEFGLAVPYGMLRTALKETADAN